MQECDFDTVVHEQEKVALCVDIGTMSESQKIQMKQKRPDPSTSKS